MLFRRSVHGPYDQRMTVAVDRDGGNGLPIMVQCATGDPPSIVCNSISVANAELLVDHLKEAIKTAKKAGIG